MRRRSVGAGALLVFATVAQAHKSSHDALEAIYKQHRAERLARKANETEGITLQKRGGCTFPTDAGLVAVTPGSKNAGWALSPDQACLPNSYCPYACPPGMVSMQWDPTATSYTYPKSMNGGLFCDASGTISKPFPDKPYCQSTANNIGVLNNANGGVVSFCQTVLPGNEAMLIPTEVTSGGSATLAVPGMDYWASTAAHYYINPPGTNAQTACVWGTKENAYGNWSPYVAGANADASGNTFIKLGWNPIYLEPTCPFRTKMPDWGVKIDCPNGGCSGLPCAIDPTSNAVNSMKTLAGSTSGAGGSNFCVVTVQKGSKANFVVIGGSGSNSGGQFYASSSSVASSTSTTSGASSSTTTASLSSSNTTSTQYSMWSDDGSTSYYSKPTGMPHYQLFNTSSPSTTVPGAATMSSTESTNTIIATHTGSANGLAYSLMAALPLLWLI